MANTVSQSDFPGLGHDTSYCPGVSYDTTSVVADLYRRPIFDIRSYLVSCGLSGDRNCRQSNVWFDGRMQMVSGLEPNMDSGMAHVVTDPETKGTPEFAQYRPTARQWFGYFYSWKSVGHHEADKACVREGCWLPALSF